GRKWQVYSAHLPEPSCLASTFRSPALYSGMRPGSPIVTHTSETGVFNSNLMRKSKRECDKSMSVDFINLSEIYLKYTSRLKFQLCRISLQVFLHFIRPYN